MMNPTKTERPVDTTITVGDTVKSFDFDYSDDCYFVGVVEEIGRRDCDSCDMYFIKTVYQVFGGKLMDECSPMIYAPVNGTESWMGSLTCGVQREEV